MKIVTSIKQWWHVEIGTLMTLAGIGILSPPGLKELLIAAISKSLSLGLKIDQPSWIGILMIVFGPSIIIYGEHLRRTGVPHRPYIAFRHHSLQPYVTELSAEVASPDEEVEVKQIVCDQSKLLRPQDFDLLRAVRVQFDCADELAAARRFDPKAEVAYYGIVHIPFQFLAGRLVQTHAPVRLFEMNRENGSWVQLKRSGPDLNVVRRGDEHLSGTDVVLAMPISYEIRMEDIVRVVSPPFQVVELGLYEPHRDPITACNQVTKITRIFRDVLDTIHARVPKSAKIHCFYAGPVSLGFSLGRQISSTIHHEVWVYNYTPKSDPKYHWALDVTSDGPPESMVKIF